MNYDELIGIIREWRIYICLIPLKPQWHIGNCKCTNCIPMYALLSVVELHKPEHSISGYRCTHCTVEVIYPCPTIQGIKKELEWTTRH